MGYLNKSKEIHWHLIYCDKYINFLTQNKINFQYMCHLVICENIQDFYYNEIATTLAFQIIDMEWEYRKNLIEFDQPHYLFML